MTKNFVATVERYVEKGILGLATVFLGRYRELSADTWTPPSSTAAASWS